MGNKIIYADMRKQQEYITFSHSSISKIIEKRDVVIVYLKNGEYWVCTKDKPIETNATIKFRLATRED